VREPLKDILNKLKQKQLEREQKMLIERAAKYEALLEAEQQE